MPAARPFYLTPSGKYEIDNCEPQQRAVLEGELELHALSKGHYLGKILPAQILPGLSSIGYWNARTRQDWGLHMHRNEGVEFMFLETGKMPFVVDKRKFNLRSGSFTVTRPWQLHKLGDPNIGPGRLHWLILDVGVRRPHQHWRWPEWLVLTAQDLRELTRRLRNNENPVWEATPAITNSFCELAGTVRNWGRAHSVSELAASINLLLVRMLEVLSRHPARDNKDLVSPRRTVEIFLSELEAGRMDLAEDWSVERMAECCRLGKSTLFKYCIAIANTGPMEFLNMCRLSRAARDLLANPRKSVTGIAMESGFNSSQYFASCFLKRYGVPPTEYRKRIQTASQ